MPDRIERATDLDFVKYYRVEPPKNNWIGWAIKNGRLVKGLAAIAQADDGRYFGFMDKDNFALRPMILRLFKKNMVAASRELKLEEVFVTCDTRYDKAESFLKHLGFTRTDETIADQKVWKWQV